MKRMRLLSFSLFDSRKLCGSLSKQACKSFNTVAPLKKKPHIIKILADLSKLRLSSLVVVTTGAGFFCAGAPILWDVMSLTCIGTTLCAASAGTFNQIIEKDRDANMNRTKMRPLPAGHISTFNASLWGITTGALGTSILSIYTNDLVACLGLFNIFLYAGPYTYTKPMHEINTWIGSLVGAIPPIMGWFSAVNTPTYISAHVTNTIPALLASPTSTLSSTIIPAMPLYLQPSILNPLLLSSILFLWQFPHFFALSYLYREDYTRGGFQMVAVNDATGARSASLIRNYTILLSTIPYIATYYDITSAMFAVEGTVLNTYLYYLTYKFSKNHSNANARKIFLTSLWYLPLLLGMYVD